MRTILVIGLWLFGVEFPLIRGTCPSSPIRVNIYDTDIGKEIYSIEVGENTTIDTFTVKVPAGVTLDETIAYLYFRPEIKGKNLTLSTTEAFKKLGSDADTNGATMIGLSVNVNIHDCNVLTLLVTINSTYAYEPIFSESSYTYSLPMPVMPKSDFTVYGQKITVSDINFANTDMTMVITPQDFDVSVTKIDNKHFEAVFSATKYLRFTESQTYTLTAMNSGSKQSQVEITINVDAANGLDEPSFGKSYYFFEYSKDETGTLKPKDDDVVVKTNKPNDAFYELTGDFKDYFVTTFDNTSNFSLELNPSKPLPSDVPPQIALTLSFTTDATGHTVIIVDILTVNIIPSFSTAHYTGKYDIIINDIEWIAKVEIKNATDVKLSDDVTNLLKIDKSDYSIFPKTSLKKSDFDENLNLVFTITATSTTKNEAQALVVLSFVPQELKFDKPYYSATYSEKNEQYVVTLDNGNDIGFSDVKEFLGIDIQVGSDYTKYFEIKLDNSKFTISVSEPLSQSTLLKNTKLYIPLTATWPAFEETASSVLILNLPEKSEVKFDKSYYTGSYVKGSDDKDIVQLNEPIFLIGAEADDISIKVEGFEDTLNAIYNPETSLCEVTVESKLNSSIIGHDSELVVTIVALATERNLKTYAVLHLDLPLKSASIEFVKKHYHATYNEADSTATATISVTDGPIILENKDDLELHLSFQGFDDTFIARYDPKTSSCEITLQSNLNSSIIGHESQLAITIVALSTEPKLTTYAVLILDLPVKTSSIEFEKKHYHATYNEIDSTSKPTVTVIDGPIKLDNKNGLELTFLFEGFDNTFTATYDTKTSSYQIAVDEKLNSSIIGHESQLAITIVALSTELNLTSYAVLILDLPMKTSSIEFEKKHYHATYNEAGSTNIATVILIDGPIKIDNNDQLDLKLSFEGYEDNFLITWDPNTSTCEITVQSTLDPSIIEGNSQLILTLTAVSVDKNLTSYTIVILDLPSKVQSIQFEKKHYFAKYEISSDSIATVNIEDGPIKIISENGMKLDFTFEDFENNFEMTHVADSSAYKINVTSSLDPTVLANKTQLIITITAHNADNNLACYTVLILELPNSFISFAEEYYVAHYQTDPELEVKLTKEIVLDAKNQSNINFSFKGYDKNFQLEYVPSTKTYKINAESALDDTVLSAKNELLIILTAEETDSHKTASTVLVLKLPSYVNDVFESSHYSAEYNLRPDSDTDEISMIDMNIKIKSAEYTAISFTGYESNFKATCDTTTMECTITVQKNLNSTTLSSSNELIVTIVATSTLQPIPGKTLLVLKLPSKHSTFAFSKQYYNAIYSIQKSGSEKATVDLEGLISVAGVDTADVTIVLDAYNDYFELSFDSTSWKLNVKENLGPEVLTDKTELVALLTASKQDKSDQAYAKATLIIKLPDKTTVTFTRTQYYGEYLLDDNDGAEILLDGDSEIETTDTDNTKIELNNFKELFLITLNSESKWSIHLLSRLNTSILSLYTELRLQMTLTKIGVSYGEAGLTIRLPPLVFSKDTYSGSYSINKNGGGSVDVEDITLGDIDASYVELKLTNYTEYFKLTQKATSWNVEVADQLPEAILNTKSELILTLTANKRNHTGSDHAKATLLIKLPDDTRVAFTKPQYYGEYVLRDPSPVVVLDEDSEITITDSVSSKIALASFEKNFQISLNSQAKWTVNVEAPLNSSILTKYSELRLLLTITKLGINYGEAGLYIRLPPLTFSEDKYSGLYSFVTSDVGSIIVDNIIIDNADASYIELKLMEYTDNFYTEKSDNKWTIKVKKTLSTDITDRQLVTNLQAIRDSDNKILATTVLVISLPDVNPTDAPVFSAITFSGDYINSDTPTVKMEKLIGLVDADSDSLPTVYIDDSNEFSTNFSLVQEKDNQYSVKVKERLSQEVLDELTNIALTLVAKSTEGNFGYATLVISLPKAVRNTSVQVENHEILFTGTYKNGVFTSPKIPLVTNSTNKNDILVEMTNDLGIDSKYFSYTYSNGILAVNVDDIPDDVLKNTSLIPLKLAIKDRNTQDMIYAVLNVEISSGNGGGTDDGRPTGADRLGLIIAVSILAALLVMLVLLVSYFWFFKRIANKYIEMEEEEEKGTKPHLFTKNPVKTSTSSLPPTRRPTGISVGLTDTLSEETSSDQDVPVSTGAVPPMYNEKKVAFSEVVEKIDEIGGGDEHVEAPNGLLSVADRRPTQFVFAYPLESGVLDTPEDSEESSDYQVSETPENPREKKKSVIFNEHIERMHIEPLEDNEDGNEDAESSSGNGDPKTFKSSLELQIESEKQLPSEIFKEIF